MKTKLQIDFEYQSLKAAVPRLEKQLRGVKDKYYFSSSPQSRTTIDSFVLPTPRFQERCHSSAATQAA